MKDIEIINIDYTGKNPDYQRTDKRLMSDISIPFMVLQEAPFYTRNCVVKGDGAILTKGKDYFFEDHLIDLQEMIGRTVCCTIRFSTLAANTYKQITVDYQKVGDPIITREFLFDAYKQIVDSDKKIDWETQVHGKPDTYYPAFHTHDISSADEVVGFGDLVLLFKQARGQVVQHGLDIYNALNKIRDACYEKMNAIYKRRWDQMFGHIQNVNNPHRNTKADLDLGNHPNWATATKEEDVAGIRDDVISTPRGVTAALENYDVSGDGYIRQGSLPFSYYGTGIYIPPPISGSFEGLGTNTGGNALCVESNGWTVLLTRGFDSKVRRLYYYYNRNVYNSAENFIFSGYAYESQVMENNGHTPNHILSGSSGRILVIGDKEAGQYYIGLGNGTLDAKSHQLMKIDMNAFKDSDGVNMWAPDQNYVMMIGKYVYIVGQVNAWAPNIPDDQRFGGSNYRRRSFYRIPVSDLYGDPGKVVTFVKQRMNFQNSEGEWAYNQEFVDLAKNVTERDGSGNLVLKRCVIGYDVPPDTAALGNPWRCQFFNMENPSNKNIAALRVFHNTRFQYSKEVQVSGDWYFCLPYTFDTTTNTLTLDSRFFHISRNFVTGTITAPEGRNYAEWYHGNIGGLCAGHAEVAAAFIPKLGYASVRSTTYYLPYNSLFCFMGYNPNASGHLADSSDWEIFNQDLTNMGGNGYYTRNIPLDSPFGFTTKPCIQTDLWEYNGKVQALPVEIFRALNRGGTKYLWARQSKDGYAYAPGPMFNFKYIDKTVIGRPPSTMFMQGKVGTLDDPYSGRLPAVGMNTKDRHSTQYGIVNIFSGHYVAATDNHQINGGLYYSDQGSNQINVRQEEGGSFYLSLLGKHTVDTANKVMTVEKIPADSIYITRANWMGLVKAMLGTKFSQISTEAGASGPNGQWLLTMYFSSKPGTGNVPPSVALLAWHSYDDPGKTYGIVATFNWSQAGTKPTGEKTITISNIKYPNPEFGPNGGKHFTSAVNYTSSGAWGSFDFSYGNECLNPTMFMEFTDQNNYEFWLHNAVNCPVPLNSNSFDTYMKVENSSATATSVRSAGLYNAAGLGAQYQYVTDYGICRPLSASPSGGAALYTTGGRIPADQYCLMQAVFIEGNWTLFINSDMVAVFNGSEKTILKTNYDLSELGIDQKNKTFYLYAMSGKTEGYYDLTLSERTASPYHLLVATIKTNAFGIEEIRVEQNFAISGFTISTSRNGGIVPASSGSQVETGSFKTVKYADLFNTTTYN